MARHFAGQTTLLLSVLLCHACPVVMTACTKKEIKHTLRLCDPHLAAISTAILATRSSNYTSVCRAFKKYALCMEPRLQRCDPSMTYRYLRNKDAYTQPPYSCTAPSVVRRTAHTQTVIDSRSTATLCLPLWMTFSVRLLTSSTLITAITNYVSYYVLLGTVL
ncbi:hypothetical protein NP493_180g00022 [Ridgeia piscesae]|uniref:Uncharacterized protein n=1 Tax=Ridgeia piscesae TaxID=27915 RepID=A0AAD9P2L6_RIDPI|nr:hypothetical protein NP493_180g00022 [Ridgeia piscesae]